MAQRSLSSSKQTARISISLSKEMYLKVEKIASEKNVSIAWIVRESISKFLKREEK
jgi:predicted transcriptional regulator